MRYRHLVVATALALAAITTRAAPPAESISESVYRLSADDRVKIVVYGEEDLSGEYLVGSDGAVSFPLVGTLKAAGLTLAQFRDALALRLRKSLKDPKVSADIVSYRPFYILGEVNKPGQYPFRVDMTVNAAVATAGGFTYRANHKSVAVQHAGETGEHRYRLTPDLHLTAGDTIRVLERFF